LKFFSFFELAKIENSIVTKKDQNTMLLHVISKEPFYLHSIELKNSTAIPLKKYSFVDLSPYYRYHWTQDTQLFRDPSLFYSFYNFLFSSESHFFFFLYLVNEKELIIFDNRSQILCYYDHQTNKLRAYDVSRLNYKRKSMVGKLRKNDVQWTAVPSGKINELDSQSNENQEKSSILFYSNNFNEFTIFDQENFYSFSFPLGGIQQAFALNNLQWILQANENTAYTLTFDPDSTTVFSFFFSFLLFFNKKTFF